MNSSRPIQRGYTLLLTLLLLSLMAVGMVGLSRISLRLALEARQAQVDLQHTWAVQSVQATLSDYGPRLLDQKFYQLLTFDAEQSHIPDLELDHRLEQSRSFTDSITLGSTTIEFVFSDEQAKFNVNELLDGPTDLVAASQRLQDLWDSLPTAPGKENRSIRLQPLHEDVAHALGVERLAAPGSIFDSKIREQPYIEPWRDHVTFWGDGRLRLGRASDEALAAVAQPIIGPQKIWLLLEFRTQNPALTTNQLLQWLSLSAAQRAQLRQRLTDSSSTYSIAMIVRERDRAQHLLTILDSMGTADESSFTLGGGP